MASPPLNGDVLTQILLRLPVQSLLRFRTASKFWRDVIDSPVFRKSHIANNDDNGKVFLLHANFTEKSIILLDSGKPPVDIPVLDGPLETASGRIITEPSDVIGPVKGLICIHSGTYDDNKLFGRNIAVCNPGLGLIKSLPLHEPCRIFHGHISVGIGFDNDAYKVVQLASCDEHRCVHASVYSKTTDSWRDLAFDGEHLDFLPVKSFGRSDGRLAHWRARRAVGEGEDNINEYALFSFEMETELFRILEMPGFERFMDKGYVEIFTNGERFVLIVERGAIGRKERFDVFESRLVGSDRLFWDQVLRMGSFRESCAARFLLSGCVIFSSYEFISTRFYNYLNGKIRRVLEIPLRCRPFNVFEYKGSFVSP